MTALYLLWQCHYTLLVYTVCRLKMCKLVHKYLRALFVVKFVEIIAKPAAAVIAILKICSTIASPNQRPIDAGGFKGRSII